jgi:hypothetical protein
MFATSRREAALTARFLQPATPALEDLFLKLRAETDLALGPNAPARYGKPYPYGYCREITCDVLGRLNARIARPRHPGERAIKVYLNCGGKGRRVWGALRERFFQNALQMGGLYIDVSNDTVDVTKPKVEILPMGSSGFESVRDAAHFATIGERYWGVKFYANHALPFLAPLFPMLGVDARGRPRLYSEGKHMVDLFGDSGFGLSERWLEDAPAPPEGMVDVLRACCSDALLATNPVATRQAALQACKDAREQGRATDPDWKTAKISEFQSLRQAPIPALARG